MRLRLLGETLATRSGQPVALPPGRKPRAVLAWLALRAPGATTRAAIIDAIWGDDPPASAKAAIETYVSQLRGALGGPAAVVRVGDGYRLADPIEIDVVDFARAAHDGRLLLDQGDPVAAAGVLRDGLALWRGPAFAGLGDAPFVAAEVTRLNRLRADAEEAWLTAEFERGRPVIGELEALLAREPWREGIATLLIRALHEAGRRADALAVFTDTAAQLKATLAVDPSAELRAAAQRARDGAAAPRRERVWARVPAPTDAIIGRAGQLAELEALVGAARLVTILGPGGVGKTRLAIELGRRLARRFPEAVAYVGLADAQTAADVPAVVAAALDVPGRADPVAALRNYLGDQRTVLICDNVEHVVDAAPVLAELLAAAPGLRIVVTSRRELALSGERVFRAQPLTGPAAAALFTARARAAGVTGPLDAAAVEEICVRCDGLPLAIELAAARTRVLSIGELRDRLSLALLTGGPRDAPTRHRTLRASIASSVAALSEPDRRFLTALAVFHGGFAADSAAAVAGVADAGPFLDTLVAHSLVHPRDSGLDQLRFDLLGTVREFLTPTMPEAVRRRHARQLRDLLGPVPDPSWHPHHRQQWRRQLVERPNLRAAIRWAIEAGESELAADLVVSVGTMWNRLGPTAEIVAWLTHVADDPAVSAGRRADALIQLATIAERRGVLAEALTLATRARALLPVSGGATGAADHGRAGHVEVWVSFYGLLADDPAAASAVERAREHSRLAGDPPDVAFGIVFVEMMRAVLGGDPASAVTQALELVRLARAYGLDSHLPDALSCVCEMALLADRPGEVIVWADDGLAASELGVDVRAWLLSHRGLARLETGDPEGA